LSPVGSRDVDGGPLALQTQAVIEKEGEAALLRRL
jgi:hypothetical protein